MQSSSIKKSLIVIGLIISIVGFGAHFINPGSSYSKIGTLVSPYGTAAIHVDAYTTGGNYAFRLDVLGPEIGRTPQFEVFLIDFSQYSLYQSGTSIEDLDILFSFSNQSRGTYTDTVTFVDSYLVILSYENKTYSWNAYYSLTPDTHFPTLLIGFTGLLVILVGCAIFFEGWKRYFCLGVSINVVFFIIRTFTLVSYSLGLPDIFNTTFHVEMYNDYQYFYLSWIPQLLEGSYPYGGDLYYYIYGPLWIYIVSIFGYIPSWLPGVPLFIFNMATGAVVQKIVLNLSGDEKKSIFAMMIYLLNPITVIYGSFMWLNPTIYTFFCSLSFLFALEDKNRYAIGTLAIATLMKQFSVIFFPLLSLYLIKKYQATMKEGIRQFFEYTIIYTMVVMIGSLPFLIIDAEGYLFWMILGNTGSVERLMVFIPDLWMPVHFNTFFLWLGVPAWFTDIMAWLLIYYIPLIVCAIGLYGGYILFKPSVNDTDDFKLRSKRLFTQLIILAFLAVLCVQLFYPRGSYKFYLLTLMPFAAVLYDIKDFQFSSNDSFRFHPFYLFTLVMTFAVFFWYRFVYFWILALWGLFYMYLNRNMLLEQGALSSDSEHDDYAFFIEESIKEEIEEMEGSSTDCKTAS
ncbi:MAG: hypothetical protein ACFFED_03365 [Candidatus Thorarchaeota archaeon]